MSSHGISWLLFHLFNDSESFLCAGGRETEMILTIILPGLQSTWISILIYAYICYRNPKSLDSGRKYACRLSSWAFILNQILGIQRGLTRGPTFTEFNIQW